MISVAQAFRWLNWEKTTHLSESSQFSVWQINDSNMPENEKLATLDSLSYTSHALADPLERAEVLANCGISRFTRGQYDEAKLLVRKALSLYDEPLHRDPHRQAVTGWILHIIQRKVLENGVAFANARVARSLFFDQASTYLQLSDAPRIRWYQEKVFEMTCDLLSSPEEAYEWQNHFEPSHLNRSALDARERIRDLINRRNFGEAYQQMDFLREITHRSMDAHETAEALSFCGLSSAQMGNYSLAIQLLRTALSHEIPASHEHTSIRWMLGIIQTWVPSEMSKGINNMEMCVRNFSELGDRADRQNHSSACEWYSLQIEAMRKVVKNIQVSN